MTKSKPEYRKVGSVGYREYSKNNKSYPAYSLSVVIPQQYAKTLRIDKGSVVKFSLSRSKIPYLKIEKVETATVE